MHAYAHSSTMRVGGTDPGLPGAQSSFREVAWPTRPQRPLQIPDGTQLLIDPTTCGRELQVFGYGLMMPWI